MLVSERTFEIKVRSRWTALEISLMLAVICHCTENEVSH